MELRQILRENDLGGDILSYHTGALNRAKIDTAVEANGFTLPLPNKVTFHLYKMGTTSVIDVHLVTWFPLANAYGIEKLTLKD